VEGHGVRLEAFVATMVRTSNVGDVAFVEVIVSSLVCPCVCLGLLVPVKSKLWWWVSVVYDDSR
jgi:hypothetical protein